MAPATTRAVLGVNRDISFEQSAFTRNGGYFEYKPMFVEKLPVPQLPLEE